MANHHHRPVILEDAWFEQQPSEQDATLRLEMAQRSAELLLKHVHDKPNDEAFHRLQDYIDTRGIEELAEMWAHAPQPSAAAALWRIYLIRQFILHDPEVASRIYRIGTETIDSSDTALVGAVEPTGPDEIQGLANAILNGVFRGDLSIALERAAAYCRISSIGLTKLADSGEVANADRSRSLTQRAYRFSRYALELKESATLF